MTPGFNSDNLMQHGEVKMAKNPLVLYHANCNDGFGAAWCFHYAQPMMETTFDFKAVSYGQQPPAEAQGRTIYLVDFCYPFDVMESLIKENNRVIVIDHHKTASDVIVQLSKKHSIASFDSYFDTMRSGARLAWDYLYNRDFLTLNDVQVDEPPLLIDYIQDRDLWQFKLAGTKETHAGLSSLEQKFDEWTKIILGEENKEDWGNQAFRILNLQKEGAAILKKYEKDIQQIAKETLRWMRIGSFLFPTVNAPGFMASDICSYVYNNLFAVYNEPEIHIVWKDEGPIPEIANPVMIAASYYDTAEHRIFSLRSHAIGPGIEVVAREYGGGGHVHAAGFKVPRGHELATWR